MIYLINYVIIIYVYNLLNGLFIFYFFKFNYYFKCIEFLIIIEIEEKKLLVIDK